MQDDRIENNPTNKKLRESMQATEAFLALANSGGLGLSKERLEELNHVFRNFQPHMEEVELATKSPDAFNDIFSNLGWIAHETMDSDLMIRATRIAQETTIDAGEMELVDYYCSMDMKWQFMGLSTIPEFANRENLIELAYIDFKEGRYHACVPVILMVIDGAVRDFNDNKSFFSKSPSFIAWDSIAGHSSGLNALKNIMNLKREKTSTEEISIPYRHGILHGRDLGYANKVVAAKCWVALFAIKDWAQKIRNLRK
jgi:hypothetical protein